MKRAILIAVAVLAVSGTGRRTPYEKAVESTVFIAAGGDTGTGVHIDPRHVLTAYHVIAGEREIFISPPVRERGAVAHDPGGYPVGIKAVVVKVCPDKDLALLRVETKGRPIRLGKSPSPGDQITVIGGDRGVRFRATPGHARAVYDGTASWPGQEVEARVIDMDCAINFGDSGGPCIDAWGELAGILSHIEPGMNQVVKAIDIGEIRAFLGREP